ncbi:3'-5' exonuclease [Bacteroides coprosuis DSM 18011]|uniref:3'-5' exonuclease n=1 Tax=Bacteroides coprosuis DSM 18011 TaxID=679937 RepID=F3ZNR1_9BACE|nr:3'-5' exonuclease [Bacteroides coprosuis]EGJ70250.1 3'-5' exonuclease [Bacteroides coprosuis DSM 18011]
MIIHRSITKEQIKQLPQAKFPGAIEVIQTKGATRKAIEILNAQTILGIDSETRPAFVKGKSYKVALLQISTDNICFLFRLNKLGLVPELIELLENPNIKKIGLSLRDDFMMLRKRASFKQENCIDLQEYVKHFGIKDKSLQKIYAILFKEKISKAQRLSNWEAVELTDAQQRYAATDAWSCLRIYNFLEELKQSGDYIVKPEVPTEQIIKD